MLRLDWRRLASVLPRGQRTLVELTLLSFASAVLEASVMVLAVLAAVGVADDRRTIDLPVLGSDVSTGVGLAAAGVMAVLSLGGHLLTARMAARSSSQASFAVRSRLVEAFQAASWARQSQDREGALQETTTTLSYQTAQMVLNFSVLLVATANLVALFLTALLVDPVVTAIVIVFAMVLFAVLKPLTGRGRRSWTAWVKRNGEFAEGIASLTTMAMDLRVFGVEQVKTDQLAASNAHAEEAMYQTRLSGRISGTLYKDLALLCLVGSVALLSSASSIDLAAVGPVILLIVRSLNYAQQAQTGLHMSNELSPNLEALLDRIAALQADAEVSGSVEIDRIDRIDLVGVSYDYGEGRMGLIDLDLTIEAGEAIGVVGPSGGGKSTLVQVLLRLRRPTSGRVDVSGVHYEELESGRWRRLVSLVPQEPQLIEGTIAENIAFFRDWVTREAMVEAATAAHVMDDIAALPAGMDTVLGPRGAGLSGGQKQRVAIARALVGEPQLLVLDEPSSALDARSEHLLQETIQELSERITLVIVAHRLTTLRSCDRILVLEGGRAQRGPRDEVLSSAAFLSGLEDAVLVVEPTAASVAAPDVPR